MKIKKHLAQRRKMKICKAHLINAAELFLSSIMNDMFAKELSAEFIVKVESLGLSNEPFCHTCIQYRLFMYPKNPEIYEMPTIFVKHDGAIDMHMVRGSFKKEVVRGPFAVIWETRGFDENIVRFMYEVMEEDGIDELVKEINKVQISFDCHKEVKQKETIQQYVNQKSDKVLIQCMLAIIKKFDPVNFYSIEIQSIKKWMLNNM
ncbi:hypothetical protein [Janthinobacterium sp. BJB446]|uniref:hypothetical protein n=1 Tax=Janthinobacterium sp. BJB446 TaxID=2048009 RepID=UPI00117A065D|nr:hypothetical protein [Janthinobacterium sp. BJB446]